jgi:hypothetical protein
MDKITKWLIVIIFVCFLILFIAWFVQSSRVVSYYANGTITKSGEMFDRNAYTAAVADEDDMYYWYRVEWNDRVVYVYANDLMGKQSYGIGGRRYMDLSQAAFARLAPLEVGILKNVNITRLH